MCPTQFSNNKVESGQPSTPFNDKTTQLQHNMFYAVLPHPSLIQLLTKLLDAVFTVFLQCKTPFHICIVIIISHHCLVGNNVQGPKWNMRPLPTLADNAQLHWNNNFISYTEDC